MGKMLKVMVVGKKKIRDPKTARVLEPGKHYNVPAVSYWLRRLDQGDVEHAKGKEKVSSPKVDDKKGKPQSDAKKGSGGKKGSD